MLPKLKSRVSKLSVFFVISEDAPPGPYCLADTVRTWGVELWVTGVKGGGGKDWYLEFTLQFENEQGKADGPRGTQTVLAKLAPWEALATPALPFISDYLSRVLGAKLELSAKERAIYQKMADSVSQEITKRQKQSMILSSTQPVLRELKPIICKPQPKTSCFLQCVVKSQNTKVAGPKEPPKKDTTATQAKGVTVAVASEYTKQLLSSTQVKPKATTSPKGSTSTAVAHPMPSTVSHTVGVGNLQIPVKKPPGIPGGGVVTAQVKAVPVTKK